MVIATPTDTHLEYIEACATAGKPICCEKPLDMTLERTDRCLQVLAAHPVPFMLGFNRRFDPQIAQLRDAVAAGEPGALRMLQSTSREPAPPPISYVESSGGYCVDAQIHDIDLMCWIAGERPSEVYPLGACLVDPQIGAAGDVDTAMTILTFPPARWPGSTIAGPAPTASTSGSRCSARRACCRPSTAATTT